MIKSFAHQGLRRFSKRAQERGIQPEHARKLARQLAALDRASCAEDMNVPGWALHALRGSLGSHWALRVSGNWRLTFRFDDGDAVLVDYQDYH